MKLRLGNLPSEKEIKSEAAAVFAQTFYCISCKEERPHFWNNGQHYYECKECGLLALDKPDPSPNIDNMELIAAIVEEAEQRGITDLVFVRDENNGRTTEFSLPEMRAAIRRGIQVMHRKK